MSFDHRFYNHSNWKFCKPIPRECLGYEPPASAGHKVVLSVFALLAVAGMVAIIWRAMV